MMNDDKNLKKMHLEQMKYLPICLLLASVSTVTAQVSDTTFAAEIEKHRKHYKEEFISEPRSPLTVKDTAFLDFYPANKGWKVAARFTSTPGAESFDMPTYSGRSAQYRQFGTLQFEKDGVSFSMSIYQNLGSCKCLNIRTIYSYLLKIPAMARPPMAVADILN
jgi:uncharacterized protein (DUF1684 family)